MSLNMPSRRLLKSSSSLSPNSLVPALASLTISRTLHTTPALPFFARMRKPAPETGIEQTFASSQQARKKLIDRLSTKLEGPSIFDDEASHGTKPATALTPQQQRDAERKRTAGVLTSAGASLARTHLARAVDPDPRSRVRWERKMLIRQVHRGTDAWSREPRADRIARTERELLSRSPWFPTSVKKLVHLARQIQGKTVAEALVQMRYSKKKMAQEVRVQLAEANDLAIVERGMGLGAVKAAKAAADAEEDAANGKEEDLVTEAIEREVIKIKTKDGKFVKIDDPTRIYIAQAWVNRGPWRGFGIDYRSRSRCHKLYKPATSISLVLKEEKTRIREYQERVAKKLRQGPWVHLPDRPVTAQRQHYSW
ncbi:ribosomal protein L22/L17 [Podospora appendiculata]|uniref:Ribosomal protein L22/L17 n=1 Tax=Podospora appendiculata TaxID=314037 RepID=A0AAE0X1X7_9PEZI|nr:ribosomal protein L22/L17 [Podospora appendiculata]